jgi:hypothetical protein
VVAPGLSVKLTVPLNGSNTEALHAMEGLALAPLFAAEHAAAAHPAPFDGTDDGIKRTPRQHNFGFTALGMRRDIDLGAGSENAPVVMTAIHAEISGDKDLSYGMAPIVRPDWMVKLARHGFAPIAVTSDKAWGLPWVEDLATAPKMAANVPYQVLFGIRGNDVFMVGFNADGSLMKHACFGQVTHMRDAEDRVAITQACAALVSSTYPEKKAA